MNDFLTTIQATATALSGISPIGVIALLAFIIREQIQSRKGQNKIATNHLHDLPDIAETLKRIEQLQRDGFKDLSVKAEKEIELLAYLQGRLNGKDK